MLIPSAKEGMIGKCCYIRENCAKSKDMTKKIKITRLFCTREIPGLEVLTLNPQKRKAKRVAPVSLCESVRSIE